MLCIFLLYYFVNVFYSFKINKIKEDYSLTIKELQAEIENTKTKQEQLALNIETIVIENNELKKELEMLKEENDKLKQENDKLMEELKKAIQQQQRIITSRSSVSNNEVELLARIIQAEALNEPFEGKLAVGGVVLNRVKSKRFPNTIRDVIFQPNQFHGVNTPLFLRQLDPDSLKASKMVLKEGIDKSDGSLYFVNKNISNVGHLFDKNHTFVKRIGNHWFYK